jgi:hypothetical protein
LPDYNGNNIPDCCERGEACVTGNYPVQWKASEGGNGNWYRLWISEGYISWDAARLTAIAFGGHLATVGETSENSFISAISLFEAAWNNGGYIGPWLGGYQDRAATDYYEPANGWQWVTGEPWQFTSWDRFGNQPSNAGGHGAEDFLHFSSFSSNWNDLHCCNEGVRSAIIEWSADCNSDGLVDYGQILQSQLADANANGVPDTCESPTCADADLFPTGTVNGADLGALLSQWGEAPAGTASDLNRDGAVDGTDLGILLAFWGPCPN